MQTANQARADCSAGQTADAGAKVDQIRMAVAFVSDLIAATRLTDGPSPPSDKSSPPVASAVRASPPNVGGSGAGLTFAPFLPNGDFHSQDGLGPSDHESRKRCASSMNEDDRVIKVMKMEPLDDISQPSLSSSSFPFPASVGPGPGGVMNSHSAPFSSNPPSSPPSRPNSSGGLPMHQLNMYRRSLPSSIPIGFTPLNVAAANGHAPPDFTPPASAAHTPVSGHVTTFGHPPEPWREHPAPFTSSHRHTLSSGHLDGDVDMKNIILGASPAFASPAAVFPSPPGSAPLATPPAATVVPAMLQSAARASRSNSLSNQPPNDSLVFGVSVSEVTIDERAEYQAGVSRPDTGFSRSLSPASSPEDDDEHDSDTGSPSHSRYRGRNGSVSDVNHQFSRQPSRRALVNQSSTDNFGQGMGANGSNHSNEVPQEYRAEVDRIFFEFLNRICSNCQWARPQM